MKKLKIIGAILGVLCVLFGFCGFFMSFAMSTSKKHGTFYSAKPINDVNGMAVDTDGYIYIGDKEGSYIQVFDESGNFAYGFSFDTGSGWFEFGIDKNNIIHIVTARTDSHLQYLNGNLQSTEKIDYDRQNELDSMYNMTTGSSFTKNNKEYSVAQNHKLKIYDSLSNSIHTIPLGVPIWPFPILVYWLIGAVGVGLIFWSFGLIKEMKGFSYH